MSIYTTEIGKTYKLGLFIFQLNIYQQTTEISHSFLINLKRSLVHINLPFIHKFIEQNKELRIECNFSVLASQTALVCFKALDETSDTVSISLT